MINIKDNNNHTNASDHHDNNIFLLIFTCGINSIKWKTMKRKLLENESHNGNGISIIFIPVYKLFNLRFEKVLMIFNRKTNFLF